MPTVTRTKRPQEVRLHLVTQDDGHHSLRSEFVKPAKSLDAVRARARVTDALRTPFEALGRAPRGRAEADELQLRRDELWALPLIANHLSEEDREAFTFIVFVNGFALERGLETLEEYVTEHGAVNEWVAMSPLSTQGPLTLGDAAGVDDYFLLPLATAKGTWTAAVKRRLVEDSVGRRVRNCSLRAWHASVKPLIFEGAREFLVSGRVEVQSGRIGLFERANLERVKARSTELAFSANPSAPRLTDGLGWFLDSGYGDGLYEVRTACNDFGDVVAVDVTFIHPEEPEA